MICIFNLRVSRYACNKFGVVFHSVFRQSFLYVIGPHAWFNKRTYGTYSLIVLMLMYAHLHLLSSIGRAYLVSYYCGILLKRGKQTLVVENIFWVQLMRKKLRIYKTFLFICIFLFCEEVRKEGNVLFNDALNTFLFTVIWRQTYGKGQLSSERGNPLPPHGLLFPISSKSSFICTIPQTG